MIPPTLLPALLASTSGAAGVPWWATILVAVVPLSGAFLAYRQATKATKATQVVDTKKVDAEAYIIAKGFYEDMLAERKTESAAQQVQILQLNEHVIVLQKSLNEMQVHLNSRLATEEQLNAQIIRLGNDLTAEKTHGQQLTRRVTQLEKVINGVAGLALPAQPE